MNITLADTPDATRVDEIVSRLRGLRSGEVLTVTCDENPGALGGQICERATRAYDHQTVHLPRKKGDVWLLHLKVRRRAT
jgi:uncharacterized protein (DUF2249 family)